MEEIYEKNILYKNGNKKGLELIKDNKTLKKIEKKDFKKFYIGSKYKIDQNNISYTSERLKEIKEQMETDNIIILKDLDSLYPSLYELFNQSFEYLPGKKLVSIGDSKSLALVNNKFKVIVLVDKNQIENQDPPFLNRFEKLKKYFNYIGLEEIKGLVYIGSKMTDNNNNQINKNEIIEFVLEKISPCFSEILLIIINKLGFKNKFKSYYQIIYESYKNNYFKNIFNYLENLNDETSISIVYTFTSIVYDVIIDEDIKNNNLIFNKSSTIEINMNSIYSMEQIKKEFINFFYYEYNNTFPKNLLILKFNEEDINKLNDIYYLLKGLKGNNKNTNQKILFIIYLKNNLNYNNYISFLSDCPQIMISNLFNKYSNFLDIIDNSNEELLNKKIFDIISIIDNNIENILQFFSFNSSNNQNKIYLDLIKNNIIKNKYIKDIIVKSIIDINKNKEDFVVTIFKENVINNKQKTPKKFLELLNKNINELLIINIKKIIYFLEKEQVITTFSNYENENIIKNYVEDYISNIDSKENNKFNLENINMNNKILINTFLYQKLPFSENLFKSLFEYIQNKISFKYLEKDFNFFLKHFKDFDLKKEQIKYLKQIQSLEDILQYELYNSSKYKIIIDIFNSKNITLI